MNLPFVLLFDPLYQQKDLEITLSVFSQKGSHYFNEYKGEIMKTKVMRVKRNESTINSSSFVNKIVIAETELIFIPLIFSEEKREKNHV